MQSEFSDVEIYKGKSFGSLLKEIVKNQNEKKDQLDILVSELRSLIKTANDALIIVPLIRDYLDIGVKNDEQLVKLAAIVQRIVARNVESGDLDGGSGFSITEEERKQLLKEVENIKNSENIKITEIK